MYKSKNLHLIIYMCIISFIPGIFSSCSEVTELEKELHSQDFSYIAFATKWYDPEDADAVIKSFEVNIYDAEGKVVFSNKSMAPKDIVSTTIPLEFGSYTASVCDGTFYSIVNFDIKESGLQIVEAMLQRISARLSIIVEDVPAGAKLDAQVLNASTGWTLAIGDDNKIHIKWSDVSTKVDIPSVTEADGTITTPQMDIMPTVASDSNSYIQVVITESNGASRSSLLTCDRMESAGKYTVKLNYKDIHTPLTLSTVTINQWETLFVYNGEVLNPIN